MVVDRDAMEAQVDIYRQHALNSFPVVLKAVSHDRAMMTYLNIDGSERNAPNENYARELMELFALGVGNYTEKDVREAARAFTGWHGRRERGGRENKSSSKRPFSVRRRSTATRKRSSAKRAISARTTSSTS